MMVTPPLACVLECSSIGSMVLLAVVVVVTRIGVIKQREQAAANPTTPAAGPSVATAALMFLVGCVVAAVVSAIVWALSPVQ